MRPSVDCSMPGVTCFFETADTVLIASPAHFCVQIFGRDHLALFGDADLPLHSPRRLRKDGLITWAAATAY